MVKFVEERTNAKGRTYWVFNPKPAVRDALDVGFRRFDVREDAVAHSNAVVEAYEAWLRRRDKTIRVQEDTVEGLMAFYRSTNDYARLKPNSRIFYQRMMRLAAETTLGQSNVTFGKQLVKRISPTHADRLYSQLLREESAHKATYVSKILRKIWFVGLRHGKVQSNPWQKMGMQSLDSREVLWEPEQVDAFVRKADEMGLWSIGTIAQMCYDMCQRPGDMRRLRWEDYDSYDDTFTLIQEKTGVKVTVPLSDRLRDRLDARRAQLGDKAEGPIAISERTGRPYSATQYCALVRDIRDAAGLPSELQVRDLRRTGATEMAEAGCTEDELRSVTGHQSRDVLSIYVRPTRKLAKSGVSKRFANTRKVST